MEYDEEVTIVEPEYDAPPVIKSSQHTCRECGVVIERAPGSRGRMPVYCAEHRKGSGSRTPNSRTAGSNAKGVDGLISNLSEMYAMLGLAVGFADGFTGMQIASRSDEMAESWRTLVNTNPKVRKALEKMVTGSGWGTVVTAHVLTVLPILVHHKIVPDLGSLFSGAATG